jgi:hypothetical protein
MNVNIYITTHPIERFVDADEKYSLQSLENIPQEQEYFAEASSEHQ